MDMYSKMDGSIPVSQVLGGVWKIQKKPKAADQREENKKKNKEKQDEEKDFEDGRIVPDDREMAMETDILVNNHIVESNSDDDASSPKRKIDIVI
jgi:hypothetical protein